jgi:hypothetical protein
MLSMLRLQVVTFVTFDEFLRPTALSAHRQRVARTRAGSRRATASRSASRLFFSCGSLRNRSASGD